MNPLILFLSFFLIFWNDVLNRIAQVTLTSVDLRVFQNGEVLPTPSSRSKVLKLQRSTAKTNPLIFQMLNWKKDYSETFKQLISCNKYFNFSTFVEHYKALLPIGVARVCLVKQFLLVQKFFQLIITAMAVKVNDGVMFCVTKMSITDASFFIDQLCHRHFVIGCAIVSVGQKIVFNYFERIWI